MPEKTGWDHLAEGLEEAIDQVKDGPLDALRDLRDLQILSQPLFQAEARRLRRKLGRDHPRVRQLEARLNSNVGVISDLEVQAEVARIEVPEMEEEDVLIHGRVAGEDGRGVEGLTLHAVDEDGKRLTDLGAVETDASGYYALRVGPDPLANLSKLSPRGIYLVVTSPSEDIVHREAAPLTPSVGDRLIVNVTLRREGFRPTRPERPPVEPEPVEPDPETWMAYGTIVDKEGQRLSGLKVRLFEKERPLEKSLEPAYTDERGQYTLAYRVRDIPWDMEGKPRLRLIVEDERGNTLYVSSEAIRLEGGRVDKFDVVIGKGIGEG